MTCSLNASLHNVALRQIVSPSFELRFLHAESFLSPIDGHTVNEQIRIKTQNVISPYFP